MRYLRPFLLLCLFVAIGGVFARLFAKGGAGTRPSGGAVAGYTLVTGVGMGASVYCAAPGETIQLFANVSGQGNATVKVNIKSSAGAEIASCDAKPNGSCTASYTVPATEGTIRITATAQGTRGDAKTSKPVTEIVVSKKQWQAAPAPAPLHLYGRVADPSQGGKNSDGGYAPGTTVRVFVDQEETEGVEDKDTCTQCGVETKENDELTYTWSSTTGEPQTGGGQTGETTDENGHDFVMPDQIGASITVTVVVEDKAEMDAATSGGSRKDGPQTLTLILKTTEKKDDGGGGEPPVDPPTPTPTPTPVTPPVVPPGPNPTPTPTPVVPPVDPTAPQAIVLTATAKDATTIELSWSDAAGTLYRSLQEAFTPGPQTRIDRGDDENDAEKISYTDTGRTPNTTYYYALVPNGNAELTEGRANATTPDLDPPSVTFGEDQLARACAGGIAGDDVHTFTITGTAKRKDENGVEKIVPEGTTFELSFENNRGENVRAQFIPNSTPEHPQTIVEGSDNEKMTVTTDKEGKFKLSVLSSDIISSDIEIKVKWKNTKGEEKDVGNKTCDFAEADNIRRFGIKDSVEEVDSGWLFNQGVSLSGAGVVTPVKVYLKFRKNPDNTTHPIDTNYFSVNGNPQPTLDADGDGEISSEERENGTVRRPLNDDGNWANVSGHSLRIRVAEVKRADGVDVSPDSFGDYVTLLNSQGQPVDFVIAVTDENGGASAQLKSRGMISLVEEVTLEAEDQNQIKP